MSSNPSGIDVTRAQLSPISLAGSLLAHVLLLAVIVFCSSLKDEREHISPPHLPNVIEVSMYQPSVEHAPPEFHSKNTIESVKGLSDTVAIQPLNVRNIAIPSLSKMTHDLDVNSHSVSKKMDQGDAELTPLHQHNPQVESVEKAPVRVEASDEPVQQTVRRATNDNASGGYDWLAMLPAMVAKEIQQRLSVEQGRRDTQCVVSILLSADGTLINIHDADGDPSLCDEAKKILRDMGGFSLPANIPDSQSDLRHLVVEIHSAV